MPCTYTPSEITVHNCTEDLYLIIHGRVYDVTKFQHEHPGGPEFLLDQGGTDVTELFEDAGHSEDARVLLGSLQVGALEGEGEEMVGNNASRNSGCIGKDCGRGKGEENIATSNSTWASFMAGLVILALLGLSLVYFHISRNLFERMMAAYKSDGTIW